MVLWTAISRIFEVAPIGNPRRRETGRTHTGGDETADTIDEISGGRLIFGLGAGYHEPEYKAFGYPFDHLAGRFEESLKIIHTLLRKGSIDFQEQYYTTRDCELRPRGPTRTGPRS